MKFTKKTSLLAALLALLCALILCLGSCGGNTDEGGDPDDDAQPSVGDDNGESSEAGTSNETSSSTSDEEEALYPAVEAALSHDGKGSLAVTYLNNTESELLTVEETYTLEKKVGTTWEVVEVVVQETHRERTLPALGSVSIPVQLTLVEGSLEATAQYRLIREFSGSGKTYKAEATFKGGVSQSDSRQLFGIAGSPAFSKEGDTATLNLQIVEERATAWMQEALWKSGAVSFKLYYMDLEDMGDKSGVYEVYNQISLTPAAVADEGDVDSVLRLAIAEAGWNDLEAGATYDVCLKVFAGDAELAGFSTKIDVTEADAALFAK